MKRLFFAFLAVGLAGCANMDFARQEPAEVAPETGHVLSRTESIPQKSSVSQAKNKTDANEITKSASLMECVSAACKSQCASGTERNSRPKWCMYFKQPADTHAVSVTSDELKKSAE